MLNLLQKSYQYAFRNCIPITATIELTHQCNFRCHHCYNFDRTDKKPESSQTMGSAQIKKVIQELNQLGTLILNFTGGEATLVPELADYIAFAKKLHMEPRLKSNGSLLTSTKVQELIRAGLAGADISIYGHSQETYFQFTQNKYARENMTKGVKELKAAGVDVLISIILHRHNVHELDQMIHFCDENKVRFNISTEITERYDGSNGARSNEITSEQFINLLQGPHREYFEHSNPDKATQCSCARSMIGIGHQGDIYPCIGAPVKSGNIFENSLPEIWNNSPELKKIRRLKQESFKQCSSCQYIEKCNRSSGSVYINTGDYTGCDPVTFKQARIRSELASQNT